MCCQEEARNQELHRRWLQVADPVRIEIKHSVLSTLGSPVREGRSTAALVVGKLAAIEVPLKMWPDLVPLLLHNITAAPTKDLKQSTFEALGYVCEEVPEHLGEFSDRVLEAIASGMNPAETDSNVKLAATTCLVNALPFVETNMRNEGHCRAIVDMFIATARYDLEFVRT